MKKKFSVEQIVAVLKQAELGVPVAEVIRKVGVSEQTFYRRKKQYVGMETDQARQMKQLQEENSRLKQPVADRSLDKTMLQDVLGKKFRSLRGAVRWLIIYATSIGRASSMLAGSSLMVRGTLGRLLPLSEAVTKLGHSPICWRRS